MSGLGYRQRTILRVLQAAARPVPFGYVVRACGTNCASDRTNTSGSLRSLRDKGLAQQTAHGWWTTC